MPLSLGQIPGEHDLGLLPLCGLILDVSKGQARAHCTVRPQAVASDVKAQQLGLGL